MHLLLILIISIMMKKIRSLIIKLKKIVFQKKEKIKKKVIKKIILNILFI